MPDQIFISYRRDDAAYVTGHINDLLRKEFGDAAVFTDVDNIALGVDFRVVLDQTVSQCQVLLAVIGANWLTVQDQEGQPRLQDPADFVRIEIESALKRNILVIPLLVSGATMPAAENLPNSLRSLAFRNGIQIRPAPDFGVDVARLIKNLRRHFDAIRTEAGDEPEVQAAPDPTRNDELKEEGSTAEIEAQRDSPSNQGESPKVRIHVDKEERARRQAELGIGHQEPKKRRAPRLWLIAVLVLAGASWYYADRNPEKIQSVLTADPTALSGTESDLDASDYSEANRADDTDAKAIFEPIPETGSDDSGSLMVGASNETAGDTLSMPDPVAGVAVETSDQTDANPEGVTDDAAVLSAEADIVDELVDDAEADAVGELVDDGEAGLTTSNETAPDTVADDERVLAPEPQHQPGVSEFISEGLRLAAIGEHEAAIQNFDEAIQLDVEQAFVYKQRGASYRAVGQYEMAIQDYDEAIRLNDEDVNAYFNRGISHYALQDYEAAIADYGVAIQLEPEFVDAYLRRADAHEAMGNAEAATLDRTVFAEFESN